MLISRADIPCSSSAGIGTESAVMPSTGLNRPQHHRIARFARAQRNQNHRELPDFRLESGVVAHAAHDGVGAAQQCDASVRQRTLVHTLTIERFARRYTRDHTIDA